MDGFGPFPPLHSENVERNSDAFVSRAPISEPCGPRPRRAPAPLGEEDPETIRREAAGASTAVPAPRRIGRWRSPCACRRAGRAAHSSRSTTRSRPTAQPRRRARASSRSSRAADREGELDHEAGGDDGGEHRRQPREVPPARPSGKRGDPPRAPRATSRWSAIQSGTARAGIPGSARVRSRSRCQASAALIRGLRCRRHGEASRSFRLALPPHRKGIILTMRNRLIRTAVAPIALASLLLAGMLRDRRGRRRHRHPGRRTGDLQRPARAADQGVGRSVHRGDRHRGGAPQRRRHRAGRNQLVAEGAGLARRRLPDRELARHVRSSRTPACSPRWTQRRSSQVPAQYRPSTGDWTGVAARSTVLVYNTAKLTRPTLPELHHGPRRTRSGRALWGAARAGRTSRPSSRAVLAIEGEEATAAVAGRA